MMELAVFSPRWRGRLMAGILVVLSAAAFLLPSPAARAAAPGEFYAGRIQAYRQSKDAYFRDHECSPLAGAAKHSFVGLPYYPVDPRFRVAGTFKAYLFARSRRSPAADGGELKIREVGRFLFDFDGRQHTLLVWQAAGQDRLTVVFSDATSGAETYGAGRLVDLQPLAGNRYEVDFNYAANPYCCYNHDFQCPLPPAGNRLPFAVQAGEKVVPAKP